ncbi:hypothetical protein [Vitiosangium sp. GDMCC 1.1324]|uniref:hypothetical protein n=1 Tax=Vitiosangium sp. (strain GDMCC 1.1324) TaxID=2138576 RepID=UPI000D3AEA32|nr:hypothetical protein [Vitiosangium sp. GDMCC 1.1324]PTL81202.1 hypothetical protein DAT35_24070 [Vitiosangium sp. GDMCC 1.1324]
MKVRYTLLLLPALLVGCGQTENEVAVDELTGQVLEPATTEYDMHRLLEDADITGGQWITTAQVQAFLQQKGSYLATYTDPAWGKTAAALIVERSKAYTISPLYMLARIQTESSLITSGTSTNLAKATGCGCPDSGGCTISYAGFGNQIECSAKKLRGYFTDLDAGRATISGWKPGVTKSTSDPCSVTPANKATAALYTYTPWVGAYAIQCGRTDIGGSSLVAVKFNLFKGEYNWGTGTTTCYSGTVDANVAVGVCVQSSSDGVWRQCLSDGTFTAGTTAKPTTCTASWPWCSSATLGRTVPARTCVQSSGDQQWHQCGAEGLWQSAPNAPTTGSGPVGTCYASYAL